MTFYLQNTTMQAIVVI